MSWRLEQPVDLLILAINFISLCIIIEVVLSWVALLGGRVPWYNPVIRWIRRIAGAILDPIRNVLHRAFRGAGIGAISIDFSPLVALVLLQFLAGMLRRFFG